MVEIGGFNSLFERSKYSQLNKQRDAVRFSVDEEPVLHNVIVSEQVHETLSLSDQKMGLNGYPAVQAALHNIRPVLAEQYGFNLKDIEYLSPRELNLIIRLNFPGRFAGLNEYSRLRKFYVMNAIAPGLNSVFDLSDSLFLGCMEVQCNENGIYLPEVKTAIEIQRGVYFSGSGSPNHLLKLTCCDISNESIYQLRYYRSSLSVCNDLNPTSNSVNW